jgi:hypothetical protein
MGNHAPDTSSIIATTPRPMPAAAKFGGIALVVIGVLSAAYGFMTHPDRERGAFIVNFLYFGGIAQGGFMLACISAITKGRWPRPLKRMAEAFGLFLIPMYILLIVFLLGGGLNAYEWFHWTEAEAPPHKAIYLNPTFFVARQVVGIGLLLVLDLLFIRASLRSDLGYAAARLGDKAPAWWGRLTAGWQGEAAEIAASTERQARLAPAVAVTYALVWSMVAIDISMSLTPHWYANMFPAWYFMSCIWSGLVYLGMFSTILRKWMGATKLLTPNVYHDLGKLTFGMTMFWAYTLFAQYLPIWYGNMTEEIGFILLRTELQPWATLSKVVIMLCFLVPWTMLLSRGLKKSPPAYLLVTFIIATGIWLERFLVVMPAVWKEETLPLGIGEIGMTLGFLGAFILVVVGFLSKVPPIVVSDPFLAPDPDHVHVLPSSQAHRGH